MNLTMTEINPIIPDILPQTLLICGFTTRSGGVSLPPFDSLNLGYKTPDKWADVQENHTILNRFIGVDSSNVAFMEQVHGDCIDVVESGGISTAADGIITSKAGILLGIKYADCIPLLLFDPVQMVISAVHCGWRPLISGIAEKAVNEMSVHCGTIPGNIISATGPSAGTCCYEIGDDVAGLLRSESVIERNGKLYADLRAELKYRLLNSGIKDNHIEIIPDCTICNKSLFFSHRRDGSLSGRMMGYIMIKD